MTQTWRSLLFAHWPLLPDLIRPLLPDGLELDTHEGQAWVGVVPFQITDIRPHLLPSIPFAAGFLELNVRTYVTRDGKPGVWFFSLDASHRIAVEAARAVFHLPYFNARIRLRRNAHANGDMVTYESQRMDKRAEPGDFRAIYRPNSTIYRAEPGSFDAWLTERYCLYSRGRRGLYRAEIHHPPWALQRAEATFSINTVTRGQRIYLPDVPPVLHYSEQQDVLVWYLERLG